MTKDDIMQALRLTAMSRVGHPLQEELAEKLAALFADPETNLISTGLELRYEMPAGGLSDDPGAGHPVVVPKRTRKTKAD